ncbi:Arylsulfatase [Caulifigura coniformis]|uniref:Arylsulfatase n=1 Tax=Caulifigura coniformis TaxID=2527983 RepID=A0A517SIF6_9PLAN|nr:sulfatase [Caulifigura coniformis]QDT55901.1 Arylsulfatase [Caulifigura coniformis]
MKGRCCSTIAPGYRNLTGASTLAWILGNGKVNLRVKILDMLGVFAGVLASTPTLLPAADHPRPNFVFILVDDMGFRDISCNGSRFFQTPNIDRLASEGMRFTNAYAACPVCSPTRYSIISGKYPARGRLTNYIAGHRWPDNSPLLPVEWQPYMASDEVTLAEALQSAGYKSACIGKWHLESRGGDKELTANTQPDRQGFDETVSRVVSQQDKGVAGLTDRALEFIRLNKDRPFFVYLAHNSVHIPLEAKPDQIDRHRQRVRADDPQNNPIYAAMVETVDAGVGRIVSELDQLDLATNTIVIFCSDNGGLSVKEGANTPATSNLPLREGKGYLHEGGIRVPLIVRWPGQVRAGSTCDVPVSTVDFYPTFMEVVQKPVPTGQQLDGESLVSLLRQTGTLQRDALFWHYPHYSNQGGRPSGAIRQGEFKLIESYEDGSLELYRVTEDPGELHNLVSQNPDRAKALKWRLDDWRREVGAQMPSSNPIYAPSRPPYSDAAKAPEAWKVVN